MIIIKLTHRNNNTQAIKHLTFLSASKTYILINDILIVNVKKCLFNNKIQFFFVKYVH